MEKLNNVKSIKDETSQNLSHSFFSSVIILILGSLYWIARFGFENNSPTVLAKIIGISLFLNFLPEFTEILKKKYKAREFWYNSPECIFLVGLILLVCFGLISPLVNFSVMLALIGIFFFMINLFLFIKRTQSKIIILAVILFSLAFSLWIAGTVWGGNYLNPLFFERITLGIAHPDSLFHISISSIYKVNWVPSTGLDGMPFIRYHWGSHIIFSQISKLLNLNLIDFYNSAYPIIFTPFVVKAFLYLINAYRSACGLRKPSVVTIYICLMIAFSGFLPFYLIPKMGVSLRSIFVSESYALGLAVLFILLCQLIKMKGRLIVEKISSRDSLFFLFFFPIVLILIGFIKISLFILLVVSAGYFFLRFRLYRKTIFRWTAIICILLVTVAFRYLYIGEKSELELHYLFYINKLVDVNYRAFFPLTYFFWLWMFLALRIKMVGAKSISDLVGLFKANKLIDVEFICLIALVGIAPGLFFNVTSSAVYFSDLQRWLALAFIMGMISSWWPKNLVNNNPNFFNMKISTLCLILLVVIMFYNSLGNIKTSFFLEFLRSNLKTREAFVEEGSGHSKLGNIGFARYLYEKENYSIKDAVVKAASEPQLALNEDKRYKTIKLLSSTRSVKNPRGTAIFIPREAEYWNMLSERSIRLLGPALSGVPMIGGIQPPLVKPEIGKEELEFLAKNLSEDHKKLFLGSYEKATENVLTEKEIKETRFELKTDLPIEQQKSLQDIFASQYYKGLYFYGFELYNFPSESEYLTAYSTDEGICRQAREKNFSKIIIIYTDSDQNPQKRELSCT